MANDSKKQEFKRHLFSSDFMYKSNSSYYDFLPRYITISGYFVSELNQLLQLPVIPPPQAPAHRVNGYPPQAPHYPRHVPRPVAYNQMAPAPHQNVPMVPVARQNVPMVRPPVQNLPVPHQIVPAAHQNAPPRHARGPNGVPTPKARRRN